MPVLDVSQGIFDIGIVRFALCNKAQDSRRSEKFEKFEALSPTDIKEPPKTVVIAANTANLEQNKKKSTKSKICCCFYSE